ncbi:MAG: hypothetical protein EX271_08670 [Acidimicrobiales bacterium]|nr:hypothetical protein [Hyphomonadaceae bacterium]RZV41123.1 MAG: hypothetical protein EX271_08670 [Acidimicrobiales bacterium]
MTEELENPALRKAPVRKFTRAGLCKKKPLSKEIEDLEWQLKFSRMKLNKWTDLDNEKWTHLREFHATKLAELAQFKAV